MFTDKIFKERKKSEEPIDKTNIDYLRMDKRVVKLIESSEEKVECNLTNCRKCIYREKDIGYCWYKMTTNKQNNTKDGFCEHFVDRERILKSMKVMKNGQSKRN